MATLLNTREAAEALGVSASWLVKARMVDGEGPIFVKIGRRVGYDPADLALFKDARRRRSTRTESA